MALLVLQCFDGKLEKIIVNLRPALFSPLAEHVEQVEDGKHNGHGGGGKEGNEVLH